LDAQSDVNAEDMAAEDTHEGVDSLVQSQSTGHSLESLQNTVGSKINVLNVANDATGESITQRATSSHPRHSHALAIAMTVAIVVPPALVIGAILGFLLRHSQP